MWAVTFQLASTFVTTDTYTNLELKNDDSVTSLDRKSSNYRIAKPTCPKAGHTDPTDVT